MTAFAFPPTLRLAVTDLAFGRGGRRLIEGLSFGLTAGEMLIVTGPNGVGKTTLLRVLAGLLSPLAGTVRLEGAASPDEPGLLSHYVGHADALKSALTAAENLAVWAAVLASDGRRSDPVAALEADGLAALADMPAGILSAGQRRRVALARLAVAPRPLWILDEPTTALDTAAQARLAARIATHRAAGGLVVAATHADLGLAGTSRLELG